MSGVQETLGVLREFTKLPGNQEVGASRFSGNSRRDPETQEDYWKSGSGNFLEFRKRAERQEANSGSTRRGQGDP